MNPNDIQDPMVNSFDSNFFLSVGLIIICYPDCISKYLLDKINISDNQIYKISTNKKSIKNSVEDYNIKINKYFSNNKVVFYLILLGIGKDGHIASLFKNNIRKKNNKIVNYVERKDFMRITLTLKCINNSKSIFLWAPGKEKAEIIKKYCPIKN